MVNKKNVFKEIIFKMLLNKILQLKKVTKIKPTILELMIVLQSSFHWL